MPRHVSACKAPCCMVCESLERADGVYDCVLQTLLQRMQLRQPTLKYKLCRIVLDLQHSLA